MKRLSTWLARRRLTPAAAQIEHLRRCLAQADAALRVQHKVILDQHETIKCLKAALIKAQFEAETWHRIANDQACKRQLVEPSRTTHEVQ